MIVLLRVFQLLRAMSITLSVKFIGDRLVSVTASDVNHIVCEVHW